MRTSLRDAMAPASSPDSPSARIYRVYANGTVDLDFGGGRIVGPVQVLDTYAPRTGNVVQVLQYPNGQFIVLGVARTANATTGREVVGVTFPFNVLPASGANPLVVSATASGAWRSQDGWGSGGSRPIPLDAPAQGRVSTALDYYRGAWFYGAGAFAAAAGRTSGTPTLHWSSSTSGYPVSLYIALHGHETKPTDAPTFTSGTVTIGPFALNSSGDATLPAWVGQALINGTAKGIGLLYLSTGSGAYAVQKGISADSTSGRLTIPWS